MTFERLAAQRGGVPYSPLHNYCHVERRDKLCWIKRIETLQVDGDGVKGRPRKRWREVLREDEKEGTL